LTSYFNFLNQGIFIFYIKMLSEAILNLLSGGCAGMISATVTCPLEVVKTRMQSSQLKARVGRTSLVSPSCDGGHVRLLTVPVLREFTVVNLFRDIVRTEGFSALWKGLVPSLIGIVPSRAVYFTAYAEFKKLFENVLMPGSALLHMCSAGCSGFVTTTLANPIWMIRTRMQLDHRAGMERMNIRKCISEINQEYGLPGFLKGVTASYAGLSETVLHFVIYEELRSFYMTYNQSTDNEAKQPSLNLPLMMLFGGVARFCATAVTYPHEVVRTRLRERNSLYRGFFNTLIKIFKQESWHGLYSGITVHMMKTVPNSAVLMGTYELVIYLLKNL
ncbi:Solute carrier family 25 member 36-A, partial [Trichinella papuae]